MDIARPSAGRRRIIRRIIFGLLALGVIAVITLGLSRLKPAAPTVDRAVVWVEPVKRGPMRREVRGLGTLAPEEVRWIPAANEGRVERNLVLPGKVVKTDTILLELSNPELDLAALDAEFQVKAAAASLIDLRVRLESQRLDQQASAARVQADHNQARLRADANEHLAKDGLIPDLELKIAQVTREELANRYTIERQRIDITMESVKAQLAVQQTRVDQLRALFRLKRSQVENLIRCAPRPADWQEDLERGLSVIAARAQALSRFMHAYARLARLPQPRFQPMEVEARVRRVVGLETRLPIALQPGHPLTIQADADQLEQLLINLLRNSVDAALETGGGVTVGWTKNGAHLDLWVADEGPGLPNTANLFVPFFTTKPGGSGIGLVLSRQIAEAHGGTLVLENRRGKPGCEAHLSLPL